MSDNEGLRANLEERGHSQFRGGLRCRWSEKEKGGKRTIVGDRLGRGVFRRVRESPVAFL